LIQGLLDPRPQLVAWSAVAAAPAIHDKHKA